MVPVQLHEPVEDVHCAFSKGCPLRFFQGMIPWEVNVRFWTVTFVVNRRAILNLLEKDIKPRDIMTKPAFLNALTLIMATGGSTNAVLHYLAIARAVNVDLTLDDFQAISDKVPLIADFKPSGKYVMEDLHNVSIHKSPPSKSDLTPMQHQQIQAWTCSRCKKLPHFCNVAAWCGALQTAYLLFSQSSGLLDFKNFLLIP